MRLREWLSSRLSGFPSSTTSWGNDNQLPPAIRCQSARVDPPLVCCYSDLTLLFILSYIYCWEEKKSMKCSILRALNSIEIPNIKGLLTFCNDNIKKENGKKKKRSTSWIVFRGPSPNNPLRSKDVLNITTLWHFRWLDGNDTTMNKREERREKREERRERGQHSNCLTSFRCQLSRK